MTSQPQDFSGWLHLLPSGPDTRVGIVGTISDELKSSIREYGATAETWNGAHDMGFPSVIVGPSPTPVDTQKITASLVDGGAVWVLNASRKTESELRSTGMKVRMFTALPSISRPKLLFELGAGRSTVKTALAMHSSSSWKISAAKAVYSRFANLLARLHIGPGILIHATKPGPPSGPPVAGGDFPVSRWDRIRRAYADVASPIVVSASPGKGQKCVIAGARLDGSVRMFCKIADTKTHGDYLKVEGSVLSDYSTAFTAVKLETPRVLEQGSIAGFTHLLLSPVNGNKIKFGLSMPDSLAASMGSLFRDTSTYGSNGIVRFIERIRHENEQDSLVDRACQEAARQLENSRLPLGLAHRDFVFWNVLKGKTGYGVIDWEWARPRHIPFQDIFHYYVHGTVNARGQTPLNAAKMLRGRDASKQLANYSATVNVDLSLAKPLFLLYLCDWLGIQRQLDLHNAPQTTAYRVLLTSVVDEKVAVL